MITPGSRFCNVILKQILMQQKFIYKYDNAADDGRPVTRRLILFFAGWGMDAVPFSALSKPGYDILLVYDYNDDAFDMSALDGYDEICVLAWSLGVWHAGRFISDNRRLPITRTIAVNGTLDPVSDTSGIPPRIYDMTSALPCEAALDKFYRRICGGQDGMRRLLPVRPQRQLDELRSELTAIRRRLNSSPALDASVWDEIYLSDTDLIFPVENMKRAWAEAASRVRVMKNVAHAIDFNALIATAFVDKELVGDKFATASQSYENEAAIQREVAAMLVEAARDELQRRCTRLSVLEIGSGVGVLTKRYQSMLGGSHIALWDLAPADVPAVNGNVVKTTGCDAEIELRRLRDSSIDLLFSSSTIQWFNSPRRFVNEVVRVLAPGGCAFISCYVDGTIPQLAEVDGAAAMHYPQLDDVLASLQGAECDTFFKKFRLEFDTPRQALAHMRSTGVNSLARGALPVGATRRLMQLLESDGKAALDFNTQFIIIRKHG